MSDYVKLVVVNKGSSLTLNGDASTEISSSVGIPTIQGYKLIGCIGGAGVGNTGLLVSSSVGSSVNMWVHNTKGTQQTWSDLEIDLLYIRDL